MKLVAVKDSEELLHHFAYSAGLLSVNLLTTALILAKTPKNSFLRFAWLPIWAWLAYQLSHSVCTTWRSLAFRGVFGGNALLIMINMFGILVLRGLDDQDLIKGGVYKAAASLPSKCVKTALFFCNLRAIGTPWQVNIATLCPEFLAKRRNASGQQSRGWWIFRTLLIMVWQYLFLNLLEVQSRTQTQEEIRQITGDDLEWPSLSLTAEQWAMRAAMSYPARMGPTRIGPDLMYRSFSLVLVLLGLSTPESWPPLFGSISNTSTLRGSWAGMTHRLVRQPLSTISNFFLRDLLGLSLKSFTGRYLTVLFVFLLSGIFHAFIEIFDDDGIPRHEQWQVVLYYVLCAVGIMFEDAAQAVWRRVAGDGRKTWHRVFGYIWVAVFFTIVHPIFLYPALRQGIERKELVPIDVVTGMGMPVAAGVVVFGGVLVKLAIGGEI